MLALCRTGRKRNTQQKDDNGKGLSKSAACVVVAQVAVAGHLPQRAYVELARATEGHALKRNLVNLIDNIDAVCLETSTRFIDEVCEQAQKSEDLKLELQRRLQLLEWLVETYMFHEVQRADLTVRPLKCGLAVHGPTPLYMSYSENSSKGGLYRGAYRGVL